MSEELILICAKALAKHVNGGYTDVWDKINKAGKTAYLNKAKAVIKAYEEAKLTQT